MQHSDGQCEHTLRLPDSFLACCALSDLRFSFVTNVFGSSGNKQSEHHPSLCGRGVVCGRCVVLMSVLMWCGRGVCVWCLWCGVGGRDRGMCLVCGVYGVPCVWCGTLKNPPCFCFIKCAICFCCRCVFSFSLCFCVLPFSCVSVSFVAAVF